MRPNIAALIWAPLVALGGCTPLHQAPLVYSSAVQVGLNVNVATPQNPGLQISMGVNALDAAYVPVAVARDCAPTDHNEQCVVTVVRASSDQGSVSDNGPRGQSETPGRDAASVDQNAAGHKAAQQPVPGNSIGANQASTVPEDIARQVDENSQAIKLLSRNDVTHDAMSVFGTFNSTSTANVPARTTPANGGSAGNGAAPANGAAAGDGASPATPAGASNPGATAGLLFGRTFSTGVASQNLTRGIRDATHADAVAHCIAAATAAAGAVTDATEKQKALQQLLGACAESSR